ncbi:NfeD family protein [Roseivirga sp. UBA838]|uniref:NfeD family protein n=1 Tax=uncultured Roseivirga sp. TaxID=543088 RepID=UPI00257EE0CD|nr:NfeD family protein [Roseivirga sp. UBA838]
MNKVGNKGIRYITRSIIGLSVVLLFFTGWASEQAKYQEGTIKVFLMEVKGDIDPRMNRYVDLALTQATEQEADLIIIEMDTYGGAVIDANDIRTRILDYEKPVWVFINNDAASAGALISIACDSIYMVPGANIGAATVVNGTDGMAAPDKYQSYMRGIMRSTAEKNGRDPLIAEGMVDDRVVIEGITEEGKVITFTTSEALKHGYCEAEVASIQDILEKNEIVDYQLIRYTLPRTERIIAFFLNPVVSGLLILVITGGIFFELQTPGVGFPLAAAGVALVLYLVPYYLNGLAANWEIAVFFVGLALIALEVFVIPGFGVAGIAGIICTVGSLIFMMLGNDNFNFDYVPTKEITKAAATVGLGVFGSVVLLIIMGYRFTQTSMFQRIALTTTQRKDEGYTSTFYNEDLVGKEGVAATILRPSGRVEINDELYDAYTRGEYIEAGQPIEVVSQQGTSLQVRTKKK